MRVVAVILNWQRPELTIACAQSVRATAPEVEILIVDNASGDDSVARIRAALPGVEIIENATNRGYAGGNRVGGDAAVAAGADAILILNNDLVVQPGCVAQLIEALEREPTRGIVAPLSLDAADPNVVDHAGAQIDLRTLEVRAFARGTTELPIDDLESDYAPGSAFLIRRAAWVETGGFDEDYFLVWEDVDLSLRVASAGFGRALIVVGARVHHEGSSTFGGAETPRYRYFLVRNAYRIAQRHRHGLARWRTRRTLDRRFDGWARSATDPAIAAAIRLGMAHGRAERFGSTPDELR